MRCNQCCKFVGLDNGDPDVDNIEATASGMTVNVSATVTAKRVCTECGNDMKTCSLDMEDQFNIEDMEQFKYLSPDDQELVRKEAASGSLQVDVEEEGAETSESGGARYKKNIIETALDYSVDINVERECLNNITLTYSGEMKQSAAASEYDEC
jgi:hypothetical protein